MFANYLCNLGHNENPEDKKTFNQSKFENIPQNDR